LVSPGAAKQTTIQSNTKQVTLLFATDTTCGQEMNKVGIFYSLVEINLHKINSKSAEPHGNIATAK